MSIHLFEFEDFKWFPNAIRAGGTDYLRHFFKATNLYKPVIPLILNALEKSNETTIIDLCSGGGGPIEEVYKNLKKSAGQNFSIILTDKFPNINAYNYLKSKTKGQISFKNFSVDAEKVPMELKGFRTIFSAIHHFRPQAIKHILKNAVDSNTGIGIFDGGDKNILLLPGIIILHPIALFICTPFFKPFKFSRIFFTYIIPLIPLLTVWDGCVSILRLYKPKQLLKLAMEVENKNYVWKAGKVKNRFGLNVAYLIGYPAL